MKVIGWYMNYGYGQKRIPVVIGKTKIPSCKNVIIVYLFDKAVVNGANF